LAIFVGSSNGTPLTGTVGSSGSAATGNWVTDGMQFYLVDLTTHSTIGILTVNISPTAPMGPVVFTANPNPIVPAAGATEGSTTLNWNAPGYGPLAIFVGTPGGEVQMTGSVGPSGSVTTPDWVTNGMQFFLVDLTTQSTLATLTVHLSAPPALTFSANPNPIVPAAGSTLGTTTISWSAPGYSNLAVLANGVQMTGTVGASGSVTTGNWVTDGMQFFLEDVTTGSVIASLTVLLTGVTPPTPVFTAQPNPISAADQATTLYWNAPGYSNLVIHVNSATGPALTGPVGSSGSVTTGPWVTNGMQFFLVNATTGATVASVVVQVGGG
jgi:hypothetical protein